MISRTCPKCGRACQGYPALSRVNNRADICPGCGIREALDSFCIDPWTRRESKVRMIKEHYKRGMRARLLRMDDPQVPPVGTEGTLRGVDDIGNVMVAWDTGSGLNVVLDEDEIEVIG